MGSVYNFFHKWYTEGFVTPPPPCLFSRTCRNVLTYNKCYGFPLSCVKVGKWGTEWGLKNRSQLMFVAFWVSLVSLVLLCVSFASLSYSPSVIEDTAWVIGRAQSIDQTAANAIEITWYFGLRLVSIDCKGGGCPSETSFKWDSLECNSSYCHDCRDVSSATITTAFFGLITAYPQITTDLQRSAVGGDLNCQKYFGILTGLVGTISNLAAMLTYLQGCYHNFPSNYDGVSINYRLGPSFYCMLIATIFKLFDVWVHLIVPVPAEGYWKSEEMKEPTADTESGKMDKALL